MDRSRSVMKKSTTALLTNRPISPLTFLLSKPFNTDILVKLGLRMDLVLDTQIRDFVLIPLVLIMFFIALFRHYVGVWMSSAAKKNWKKFTTAQILYKVRLLRTHMSRLSPEAFQKRKTHYIHPNNGVLNQEKEDAEANTNPMNALLSSGLMDPNGMSDVMKKQMFAIASQMFFFTWIDRMFAGFISAKLPFGLTQGFKAMFQSGIDLQDLSVSYVSSISWYILISSGLQGIISVLLGSEFADMNEATLMQNQLAAAQGGPESTAVVFKAEKDFLDMMSHRYDLENTETRLLAKFSRRLPT